MDVEGRHVKKSRPRSSTKRGPFLRASLRIKWKRMQRFCEVTRECPVKFPRCEGHLFLPVEDGPARVGRRHCERHGCEHKHNNENDRNLKLPPGGACAVGAYAPAVKKKKKKKPALVDRIYECSHSSATAMLRLRPDPGRKAMKSLHLLRHAKSSWKDPGLNDHDRPLSKRGRQTAAPWRFSDACRGAREWFCDAGVRETCTKSEVARAPPRLLDHRVC